MPFYLVGLTHEVVNYYVVESPSPDEDELFQCVDFDKDFIGREEGSTIGHEVIVIRDTRERCLEFAKNEFVLRE
jgi:hypothetical protein